MPLVFILSALAALMVGRFMPPRFGPLWRGAAIGASVGAIWLVAFAPHLYESVANRAVCQTEHGFAAEAGASAAYVRGYQVRDAALLDRRFLAGEIEFIEFKPEDLWPEYNRLLRGAEFVDGQYYRMEPVAPGEVDFACRGDRLHRIDVPAGPGRPGQVLCFRSVPVPASQLRSEHILTGGPLSEAAPFERYGLTYFARESRVEERATGNVLARFVSVSGTPGPNLTEKMFRMEPKTLYCGAGLESRIGNYYERVLEPLAAYR